MSVVDAEVVPSSAPVCVAAEVTCVTPVEHALKRGARSAASTMSSSERWTITSSHGQHVKMVYMEKQCARLCGQHAVNNLLQGPNVTLDALLQESRTLERRFRKACGVAPKEIVRGDLGMDREQAESLAESPYITAAGDFSIEVLIAVLQRRFGISLVPLAHPSLTNNIAANPTSAPSGAFVMHKQDHWYSLRRLHGRWWRLDSVKSHPIALSEFYVSAFLADAQQHEGYAAFVATGDFAPFSERLGLGGRRGSKDDSAGLTDDEAHWWTLYELERLEEQTRRRDMNDRAQEREREGRLAEERRRAAATGGETAMQRALEDSRMQAIIDESRRMAAGGNANPLAPVALQRSASAPSPSSATGVRGARALGSSFYAEAAQGAAAGPERGRVSSFYAEAQAVAVAVSGGRGDTPAAQPLASSNTEWQNFDHVVPTDIVVDAHPTVAPAPPRPRRFSLTKLFRR